MPLSFNFGAKFTTPRITSDIYKYTALDQIYTIEVDGKPGTVNVEKTVRAAWRHLEQNCAKSAECNAYFAQLSKKLTLAQCMAQTEFVIHFLTPKTNARSGKTYTHADLPLANTADRDIGLGIYALSAKTERLAATLLHEIAHFAGASTNTRGDRALEAENALIPCGLKHHYQEGSKG